MSLGETNDDMRRYSDKGDALCEALFAVVLPIIGTVADSSGDVSPTTICM